MDNGQIRRHTSVVLFANIASLIFGLGGTVAVAHYFGTGRAVDAFFIALSIPQIIGQIVLSIAIVAVVPYDANIRARRGAASAQRTIASLFYGSTLFLGGISVAIAISASQIIHVLAPGFDATTHATAVSLLRWMSPLVICFGLSGILQGVANSRHSFARPAWAKPLPTATALGLLLVFAARLGLNAYVWGMLAGALGGLIWQFREVWAAGHFHPRLAGFGQVIRDLKKSMGTLLLARLMDQSGVLVLGMIASTLSVGAVSALAYALKIVSVPFLAAASFGIVIFPALADAAAKQDGRRELRILWRSVRALGLFGLLFTVPIWLWAEGLIMVLFERGMFGAQDTAATSTVLRICAVGIACVAANTTIGNAFWARRWFGVRLKLEAVALIILVGVAYGLSSVVGIAALAIALVSQFTFLCIAGLTYLHRRDPSSEIGPHLYTIGKAALIAVGVAAGMYAFVPDTHVLRDMEWPLRIVSVFGGMSICSMLFLAIGFLFKIPEVNEMVIFAIKHLTRRGRALDDRHLQLIPARIRSRIVRLFTRWIPRPRPRSTRPSDLGRVVRDAKDAATFAQEFRTCSTPPGLYDFGTLAVSDVELELAVGVAMRREVDLLGSGLVSLGRPVQWQRDYVSGYNWPGVHHSRINLVDLETDADCKFPWEVARCQHWTHLACSVAHPERTTREFLNQFEEFVVANPPEFGVNYGNAMEVAIRSANWLCAFRARADMLSDDQIAHLGVEMAAAGRFIRAHLEDMGPGLNTNHYIADLLGLYVIGTMMPSLKGAVEWREFASCKLDEELKSQFDSSGVHCEGSPAYARLVIEFYLFAYLLGKKDGDPRVHSWQATLESAVDYLAALIYPDGGLPRLGDDDAGRLLVPPGEPVDDYRYLIQVGAVLFERADWKAAAGDRPRPGLDFWLGAVGVQHYRSLAWLPRRSEWRVFTPSGIAVRRTSSNVLVIQGGRTGDTGPRAHLHNDLTSLEYFADGERWILDSGTYQYSRQSVWRNRFRSTAAHTVLQIDDVEQNRIRPDWLFYLSHDATPLPVVRKDNEIVSGYDPGSHAPFGRVKRRVSCSTDGRVLHVHDSVQGDGEHRLVLGINVARNPFTYIQADMLLFTAEQGSLLVYIPTANSFVTSIKDGWCSSRFGVRERCFRIEATGSVHLPVELVWRVAAIPAGEDFENGAIRLRSEVDAVVELAGV